MLQKSQVKQIAVLAKLSVNENIDNFSQELSSILNIVDNLQQIKTTNITPMFNPHDDYQRLRDDEITAKNNRDLYQSISKNTENGYYLVPKVL